MILPNSKYAQGHVEMMISLSLFVGAVLFIFIFMNPLAKNQDTTSYIKNVEREIINNLTEKVGKLSIISTAKNGCYDFNEDAYKKIFNENEFTNVKYVEILENSASERYKYSIYFSEIFESTSSTNKRNCNKKDYVLSSYSEDNFVISEKIKELKANYESDYKLLKKNLGLNKDFSFSLKKSEEDLDMEELSVAKKSTSGVQIESEFIPIIVIDNQGNIQQLMLNIKVW
jgi:hypothetical protein